jgi:hypothetical protein
MSFGLSSVHHGTLAASGKKSYNYTFSGTTKPAGIIDVAINAGAGTTSVSGGIIREGNSTASNGTYHTASIWGNVMNTSYYTVSATNGALSTTNRGFGPGMSDSAGTKIVYVIVCSNTSAATIQTFVSGTVTTQASLAGLYATTSTDIITLVPTVSAGLYTYTVYKNGSVTALTWTDSSSVVGLPGRYPCGVFKHIYSSGQFTSPGIRAYAAADI